MKRDMDLVRKILLAYEASKKADVFVKPEIDGYTDGVINAHSRLMCDGGLLEPIYGIPPRENIRDGYRVTWAGYDFLEASRDEKRWKKAKEIVGKVGVFTIEILKQVLAQLIQTQLKQVMGV